MTNLLFYINNLNGDCIDLNIIMAVIIFILVVISMVAFAISVSQSTKQNQPMNEYEIEEIEERKVEDEIKERERQKEEKRQEEERQKEEKRQEEERQEFNFLSSTAVEVDNIIDNNKIKQICKNFLKKEDIVYKNIWACEYMFVPVINTVHGIRLCKSTPPDIQNTDSIFMSHVAQFTHISHDDEITQIMLNWRNLNIEAPPYRNSRNEIILYEMLTKLIRLFNMLVEQGVLSEKNDKQYLAFVFVMYYNYKQLCAEKTAEKLEFYGLRTDDSIDDIVTTLYKEGTYSQDEIIKIIEIVENIKNNNSMLITEINVQDKVQKIIQFLKDKDELNELLSDADSTTKLTINDLDLMSGWDFEEFVGKLFQQQGYHTTLTKKSGDQGIDIIAERNNYKIAIQCKCYSKPVGNHAIMEAFSGAKHYNANKCMVVTNNSFTNDAIKLAQTNDVALWDRKILSEKLKHLEL